MKASRADIENAYLFLQDEVELLKEENDHLDKICTERQLKIYELEKNIRRECFDKVVNLIWCDNGDPSYRMNITREELEYAIMGRIDK